MSSSSFAEPKSSSGGGGLSATQQQDMILAWDAAEREVDQLRTGWDAAEREVDQLRLMVAQLQRGAQAQPRDEGLAKGRSCGSVAGVRVASLAHQTSRSAENAPVDESVELDIVGDIDREGLKVKVSADLNENFTISLHCFVPAPVGMPPCDCNTLIARLSNSRD